MPRTRRGRGSLAALRRTARSSAFVSALAAAAACTDPGGLTLVTVQARPAVGTVERLDVSVSNGDSTQTQRLAIDGRGFPLTFSVETRERAGDLAIDITAQDLAGAAIAAGALTVAIQPDLRLDVDLMLEPNDFAVNTSFIGDQALAFRPDAAGRQLAVSPTGVATIGWSDSCEDVAARCDVFGRRFDPTGRAVATASAAGDGQFNINQSNDPTGFEPSVATNADGVTLAVWASSTDLLAVAIDGRGAALTATETVLASATAPSTPAVTALPGGRFVVAWTEASAVPGPFVVKARYVEATGLIGANPVSASGDAYVISTTPLAERGPPALVALGDGNAHAVIWRTGSTLRARFYTPTGQPRAADLLIVGHRDTDRLGEPLAARVEGDVVVTYARRSLDDGSDAVDGQIVVRRVTTGGTRIAESLATRAVELPSAAIATRADGAIAVSWESCLVEGDGAACGIRLQVFRPSLAPVGPSRLVNTTVANNQLDPSVGWLPDGALIAAWSDASGAAPDRDGFGIRARIVYPAYDDARGVLGARCTASPECGTGNVCMPGSDDQPRCYRTCITGSGATACPWGGTCTTLGSESGCRF